MDVCTKFQVCFTTTSGCSFHLSLTVLVHYRLPIFKIWRVEPPGQNSSRIFPMVSWKSNVFAFCQNICGNISLQGFHLLWPLYSNQGRIPLFQKKGSQFREQKKHKHHGLQKRRPLSPGLFTTTAGVSVDFLKPALGGFHWQFF